MTDVRIRRPVVRSAWGKELKVLWTSPLPYVLAAVLHATLGVLGHGQIASRGQALFQPIVPIAGFLLMLAVPVLTARSIAEEARTGSLELLLAVPVPATRLVVGKYLALLVTVLALVAPTAVFAGVLGLYGNPDPGPVVTGLLGLALMGAALAGVGLLSSAVTSSQPLAAIGGVFAVLLLWFAHAGADVLAANEVVAAFSISERLRSFASGVVDLSDLVFFPSVAALCVAGAAAAVSWRRWR